MSGTRLYIGRLHYSARERDVEHFFRGYGRIRDIVLKNGFGFVEFDDYRDAEDASYELNGKELCGERVILEKTKRPPKGRDQDRAWRYSGRYGPPTQTKWRLVVENLSSRISWQDLKDFMRQAGEVTYADAHKLHRNEGVVCFASRRDLETALDKLDATELNGRKIKLVDESRRSKSRSRSRRRSRSRSRSKSRSRSRSRSHSRSRRSSKSKSKSKSSSRSRSRSRSDSKSKSRSKSPEKKERSRSRSKDKDKEEKKKKKSASGSRSKSRSRSKSKTKSKSRSASPSKSKSKSPSAEPKENGLKPEEATENNED